MNGLNGLAKSLVDTWAVLPNTPVITGICALSPSRKNPKTVSLGDNLTDLLLFAAPEPSVGDNRTCAQGRSSSGRSTSLYGW